MSSVCMAKQRIRIDLIDDDQTKYDFKIEGNITREKMLKIYELMKIMDIENGDNGESNNTIEQVNTDSTGSKIWHVVDKYYPLSKFTSTAILEKYEDEFNEPIKLSVISTYLSRFSAKNKLDRVRTGREWTYQTIKISQKH